MSTTAEAGAPAPVDVDAVIAEQREDIQRLTHSPRTYASRLKAIDDHIGTEYPAELGASAAAAGAEAKQHMAGRLVQDTKAEAEAAVQGYTKRAQLLADSLKAIPREQLDHARLANLRADIASQLESPPPSAEPGLDPRLSLIYDSWQRASETGDAELAHAVRIVGGPVATNIRRQTATAAGDSADGRMSRTLDSAFRDHSGRDATHSTRAAIEQHRRIGLELAGVIEGMQHVATGRNPGDPFAGIGDDWAAGLAGVGVPLRRNQANGGGVVTSKADQAAAAAEEEAVERLVARETLGYQRAMELRAQAQGVADFEAAMERPGVRDRFVANQDAAYDRLAAEWRADQ